MEILTLPMREGILYLPCPSGIGIEILTLSVRVSIGMFSAHIKEYDYSFPVSQVKYDTYLTSEGGIGIEKLTLHPRVSISILTPKASA